MEIFFMIIPLLFLSKGSNSFLGAAISYHITLTMQTIAVVIKKYFSPAHGWRFLFPTTIVPGILIKLTAKKRNKKYSINIFNHASLRIHRP
jgi:hypothetical protein